MYPNAFGTHGAVGAGVDTAVGAGVGAAVGAGVGGEVGASVGCRVELRLQIACEAVVGNPQLEQVLKRISGEAPGVK